MLDIALVHAQFPNQEIAKPFSVDDTLGIIEWFIIYNESLIKWKKIPRTFIVISKKKKKTFALSFSGVSVIQFMNFSTEKSKWTVIKPTKHSLKLNAHTYPVAMSLTISNN